MNDLQNIRASIAKNQHAFKRRASITAALSVVVAVFMSLSLMLPAISMTKGTLVCGLEEHVHTEACYEETLICQKDEGPDHQHSDACYEKKLTCKKTEHKHTAACYDQSTPSETDGNSKNNVSESDASQNGGSSGSTHSNANGSAGAGANGDANNDATGGSADDATSDAPSAESADGTQSSPESANDPNGTGESESSSSASAVGTVKAGATSSTPAQTFKADLKNRKGEVTLSVAVDAPEGALPAGTFLKIEKVAAGNIEDAVNTAIAKDAAGKSGGGAAANNDAGGGAPGGNAIDSNATDGGATDGNATDDGGAPGGKSSQIKAAQIQAVGIEFHEGDANGKQVEPARDVTVTLTSSLIAESDEPLVVHVDEQGEASVVDTLTDEELEKREIEHEDDQLLFDSDKTLTYGIVETTIEANVLASDGNNYKITVSYDDAAQLPAGSMLDVEELTGDAYDSYLTSTALEMEARSFDYARIFDIAIVDEQGNHLTPAAPVKVTAELLDASDDSQDFSVVHFDGETQLPEEMDADTDGNTVTFSTESFSAYAIVQGPTTVFETWSKLASVDALTELAAQTTPTGLYIGTTGGYFVTNETAQGNLDKTTTGIVKTKPATSEPPTDAAAMYYFESAENDGQFYIYCYTDEGTKQYVQNTGDKNLYLTTDETEKTAFTVQADDKARFRMSNGDRYWNMWNAAGGNHIAAWNQPTDSNNYFYIWKHNQAENDPYGLDGTTYGLMNWDGATSGKALMASSSAEGALDAMALTVMTKTGDDSDKLFVPDNSDISMWTFEWIENDVYHLSATVDSIKYYLKITSDGPALTTDPDDDCEIRVIPGTGTHAGEISLKSGSTTLTYSGNIDTGFNVGGSAGSEWLNLAKESELTDEYFLTYSAQKISVSDESVTNGSRIIVYTRVWDDTAKKYNLYAIDSDGTLVPCFDSGDSIQWVGKKLNSLLWNFVEYYNEGTTTPNYYYELYNQYSEQYIAPQVTDGQILSDSTIGINMNGRRNGKYYSEIVAWDDANYAYAGLKVDTESGKVVSCPLSEADDFYFAVMQDIDVDDTLHTVSTIDNAEHGITMKMVNFDNDYFQGTDARKAMASFLGSNDNWMHGNTEPGLLSTSLGADGYPTTKAESSLSDWFASAGEVNHLFLESTYNESGYFEYDSTQNFAHLNTDTSGTGANDFTVYKEIGTTDSASGKFYTHGQFFPYNDLVAGVYSTQKNLTSATGADLPESDPRKYEQLYHIQNGSKPDYYLGMEVDATFTQTPSGLDDWGHDIIYEFTGDDDFWLYVDGELVIDLGGIHDALPGSINYRTGELVVNGARTTLRNIFESNYRARNPEASDDDVAAYLNEHFEEDSSVFKDYTTHSMKIFYLERGAGASNLHMRFNLASVKPGTVLLSKELSGVDASETTLAEFPYQIWYRTKDESGDEGEQTDGADEQTDNLNEYLLVQGNELDRIVTYKGSTKLVPYKESLEIDGVTYENVFMLKPGETAEIVLPDNTVDYRIVECGVNTDVFTGVKVNETVVEGSATTTANRKDYGIDYETSDDRATVKYTNTVNPSALRTLTFSKKLFKEDGETPISGGADSTTFSFRLYLGAESDTDPELANMRSYHVKDPSGYYCTWNVDEQKFVSTGKTNYDDLDDNTKRDATFPTSMYGSITRIPVDYTVEVRNVLAGTKYKVEERDYEIPDGYSLQKYVLYEEAGGEGVASDQPPARNIVANKDPHVDVCNMKGWGLRVNKVWSDKDYMSERDATYFAVFARADDGTEPGNLTLVESSVRQLAYGESSLYWYYLGLPVAGVTDLDHYEIREVTLSGGNPTVGENGVVTDYGTVTPIVTTDGKPGTVTLQGTQKGESESSQYEYSVIYDKGAMDENSNVRVDTVTNNRPGIVLKKTDWEGNLLAGATFTLAAGESEIGTYTSDDDGLITVAFLSDDVNYTLTETKAPVATEPEKHFHGLESEMTIQLKERKVSVSGVGEDYYVISEVTETPTLTIKNRPYTFAAVKIDATDNSLMKGVKFALYKQHKVDDKTEFIVMDGYENLVTDDDGVISQVDETLGAGTYELREVETPDGYKPLSGYIDFTISETGAITLGAHPDEVELTSTTAEDGATSDGDSASGGDSPSSDGSISYVLTIKNVQQKSVSFKKIDSAGGGALADAVFDLYRVVDGTREDSPLYTGMTSGADGILACTVGGKDATVFALPVGTYHLVETSAPAGYNMLTDAVVITISKDANGNAAISYDDGTILSAGSEGISENGGIYTLKISNTTGYELPSTGGPGASLLYLAGTVLVLLASTALLARRKRSTNYPRGN